LSLAAIIDTIPQQHGRLARMATVTSSIKCGSITPVCHHRLLLPDNSVKHIHLVGHATRDKYGRLEYVGSAQDVTQQRLAEEQLTLITNVIPTFIHVLRVDGSVLYANRAVLDYSGLTLDDVLKEDYRDRFFHPEDVERLREERQEALMRPVLFENEQRIRDKNGEYRWFLARYNPLLDSQGRIDRWYVAGFDIEDRKRTEHLRLEERVNERTRIARELHDTLLQSVQGLLMQLSAVRYLIPNRPRDAAELLDRMVERAREAVAEGRDTVQGLRSSIDVSKDLVTAITAFGEGLANDANSPEFRVTIEGKVR
jgi:PAS domain S-box-containing protein